MKEAEALILRARKYLRSADLLLSAEDFESAVSRAYYAMFFSVQAALLTQGVSASTHKGVIATFGESFVKSGIFPRDMGRQIASAFQMRQLGDYEFTPVIARSEAIEVVDSAKAFVARIEAWLAAATSDRHAQG